MFIIRNFLVALAQILNIAISIYIWIVIIRAVISWVHPDPYNPIVQFLVRSTEPLLQPIRRFLPTTGIDFSPFILILALYFVQRFLVSTLYDLARVF
ncbi:YggT family protein [candidate division KSB1 bacterium]|nr:YggT family protein [bacterium]OQX58414.1 MAG: hypothetical protein B5M50_04425 [candidate division KSB1 bacterium 4484_219]RKY79485.1 MAG: YggT family protein [candidate division KSB1 bacterium]HEC32176.1 YggT family protein [Deltaproteobacteria bacterium]RKY80160.1 MAG: YggT family protein [candidate division KSB1 bacterium]